MRFPMAPTSLRGIRVRTGGIEPEPNEGIAGGLETPSERGNVWKFLLFPGNLLLGQSDSRDLGTPRRPGIFSWECPAWRREGSRESSEPLPVPGGAPGELEREFGMRDGGTGRREWLPLPEGRDGWDLGRNSGWEGGEGLGCNSQRICGCPIPGIVQCQLGQGLEQLGVVQVVQSRELTFPTQPIPEFCPAGATLEGGSRRITRSAPRPTPRGRGHGVAKVQLAVDLLHAWRTSQAAQTYGQTTFFGWFVVGNIPGKLTRASRPRRPKPTPDRPSESRRLRQRLIRAQTAAAIVYPGRQPLRFLQAWLIPALSPGLAARVRGPCSALSFRDELPNFFQGGISGIKGFGHTWTCWFEQLLQESKLGLTTGSPPRTLGNRVKSAKFPLDPCVPSALFSPGSSVARPDLLTESLAGMIKPSSCFRLRKAGIQREAGSGGGFGHLVLLERVWELGFGSFFGLLVQGTFGNDSLGYAGIFGFPLWNSSGYSMILIPYSLGLQPDYPTAVSPTFSAPVCSSNRKSQTASGALLSHTHPAPLLPSAFPLASPAIIPCSGVACSSSFPFCLFQTGLDLSEQIQEMLQGWERSWECSKETTEPLPVPEGTPGELEREFGGRDGWDIGKEFLAVRVVRPWDGIPGESVATSSLEVSKAKLEQPGILEGPLSHGIRFWESGKDFHAHGRGWGWMILKSVLLTPRFFSYLWNTGPLNQDFPGYPKLFTGLEGLRNLLRSLVGFAGKFAPSCLYFSRFPSALFLLTCFFHTFRVLLHGSGRNSFIPTRRDSEFCRKAAEAQKYPFWLLFTELLGSRGASGMCKLHPQVFHGVAPHFSVPGALSFSLGINLRVSSSSHHFWSFPFGIVSYRVFEYLSWNDGIVGVGKDVHAQGIQPFLQHRQGHPPGMGIPPLCQSWTAQIFPISNLNLPWHSFEAVSSHPRSLGADPNPQLAPTSRQRLPNCFFFLVPKLCRSLGISPTSLMLGYANLFASPLCCRYLAASFRCWIVDPAPLYPARGWRENWGCGIWKKICVKLGGNDKIFPWFRQDPLGITWEFRGWFEALSLLDEDPSKRRSEGSKDVWSSRVIQLLVSKFYRGYGAFPSDGNGNAIRAVPPMGWLGSQNQQRGVGGGILTWQGTKSGVGWCGVDSSLKWEELNPEFLQGRRPAVPWIALFLESVGKGWVGRMGMIVLEGEEGKGLVWKVGNDLVWKVRKGLVWQVRNGLVWQVRNYVVWKKVRNDLMWKVRNVLVWKEQSHEEGEESSSVEGEEQSHEEGEEISRVEGEEQSHEEGEESSSVKGEEQSHEEGGVGFCVKGEEQSHVEGDE
ncbi:hypothetical protein DV515_00017381, partial [Chloebia gouldiae]